MFCDVTGSTSMAEQLDPEEWAEIMDAAYEYLIPPIRRYDGTVARLMGDAVLAFFGAPSAHEDDPERAILAGLDIVAGLQPFRVRILGDYGLDFNVRVGINTGVVVVGEIGAGAAFEYTAMGDAVNLAARMEQSALPGTVQISSYTYRLVAPLFEVEALGKIEIKGKREAVSAYRVIGRREAHGRVRGLPGLQAPLIGRKDELKKLRQALEALKQGRGSIVHLIGEAGLGKSRLIEELHQEWLRMDGSGPAWLEGRGIPYDSTRAYGLFRQLLDQLLPTDGEPASEAHPDGAVESLLKVITDLLKEGPGALVGEGFRNRLYESTLQLGRALAARNPMVAVFDDLHWADPASVDLIAHLYRLSDSSPILYLCACRPYRQSPAWALKETAERDFPHRYVEVDLRPLDMDQSSALINSLLAACDLPPEMRQRILQKAEGNPFFVEEVVRALIERGAIVRAETGDRWKGANGAQDLSIPDTLQALMLARLDQLEWDVRRTLQLASVIGRSFYYRVLQWISETQATLDGHLNTLQRVDLIRESARMPELEYVFRHELTRDAAYQSILRRQRREYHRRVAEAIETLYSDRLETEAHRLAYHFHQAGEDQRALIYYRLAGDEAARLYANAEASDHYDQAIAIASLAARRCQAEVDLLIHLYTRRGRVLEVSGNVNGALENYRALEALGQELGEPALELAAQLAQATIYATPTVQNNPTKARQLAESSLSLARQLGDRRAEAKALWNRMLLAVYFDHDIEGALQSGEQALQIACQPGLEIERSYILHDIARPYLESGKMELAWEALKESQATWRETSNLPMLTDNLITMAQGLYLMGSLDRGVDAALEGLHLSQQTSNLWGQAYALGTVGPIYLERGEIDQGISALLESIPLAEKSSFAAPQVSSRMMLAWAYTNLGDMQRADQYARETLAVADRMEALAYYKVALESMKEHFTGERPPASAPASEDSDRLRIEWKDAYFGPMIIRFYHRLFLQDRSFEEALTVLEHEIPQVLQAGVRLFLPDLLHLKHQVLIGLGRSPEAYQALVEAFELTNEIGSRRSQWLVLGDLIALARIQADPGEAGRLQAVGIELVDYIAGHIQEPGLRSSFLSHPTTQAILKV